MFPFLQKLEEPKRGLMGEEREGDSEIRRRWRALNEMGGLHKRL